MRNLLAEPLEEFQKESLGGISEDSRERISESTYKINR